MRYRSRLTSHYRPRYGFRMMRYIARRPSLHRSFAMLVTARWNFRTVMLWIVALVGWALILSHL